MESGHEFMYRVEWDFGQARKIPGEQHGIDPAFGCQCQQGAFGGIADQFAVVYACVGTKCGRP